MDIILDNLGTIIFVIIIVVAILKNLLSAVKEEKSKTQKKQAPQGKQVRTQQESPKPLGLGKLLGELVTQVRKEMEKQAQPAKSSPTPWEALVPSQKESKTLPKQKPQLTSKAKPQKASKQQHKAKPALIKAPESKPSALSTSQPDNIDQQAVPEKRETSLRKVPPVPAMHCRRRFSHRELRRAVIWSEILGPPVALKQTSENQNP